MYFYLPVNVSSRWKSVENTESIKIKESKKKTKDVNIVEHPYKNVIFRF